MAPLHLRLALWGTNHIHYSKDPTIWQHIISWLKYIPSCLLLVFVISFPGKADGEIRNNGRYDAFPYRFWGYAKAARNPIEQAKVAKAVNTAEAVDGSVGNLSERILLPRWLCVPKPAKPDENERPYVRMNTQEYTEHFKSPGGPRYLFICYSTEQFRDTNQEESKELHRLAIQATLDAGLDAYWVGCSCMAKDDKGLEQDVFCISDVVRAASEMAIMVRDGISTTSTEQLLQDVGDRLWTLPEVLLSPAQKPIRVYRSGHLPISFEKNKIPASVWKEHAKISKQLIDHFEKTLPLSRLELPSVALKALAPRRRGIYLDGDVSYALMGLMRLRPVVDHTDTEFQAFARLSLANDSDHLIERLMCVLPKDQDQPWHCMDDAYKINLWDIYPSVQVAGVGQDDTVILDNARAASVRWKSFVPVHSVRRFSWTRQILKIALHSSVLLLIVGALCIRSSLNLKEFESSAVSQLTSSFESLTSSFDSFEKRGLYDDLVEGAGDVVDAAGNAVDDVTSVAGTAIGIVTSAAVSEFGVVTKLLSPQDSDSTSTTGYLSTATVNNAAVSSTDTGDSASSTDTSDSASPTVASNSASTTVASNSASTTETSDVPALEALVASFLGLDLSASSTASSDNLLLESLESKIFDGNFVPSMVSKIAPLLPSAVPVLASLASEASSVPSMVANLNLLGTKVESLPESVIERVINTDALLAWGIILVVWSILLLAAAPKLLRTLYGGKFWNTQPWLFGFEGYMDIETIEAQIFGTCKGRLRWSAFGSPLSRHRRDEHTHCEPLDPTSSSKVRKLIDEAKKSKVGEQKIFTIVDTNTMTCTLFQAARAPVTFLLLGSEGGMQRAVGCSYDWTTETLHRETVLRMETAVLDKMDIIPRVKLSIQRQDQALR